MFIGVIWNHIDGMVIGSIMSMTQEGAERQLQNEIMYIAEDTDIEIFELHGTVVDTENPNGFKCWSEQERELVGNYIARILPFVKEIKCQIVEVQHVLADKGLIPQ